MVARRPVPRVVLLCHEDDRLETQGLTRWLASSLDLTGLVLIRGTRQRRLRALRREWRRSGWTGLLDALAFRVYYALAMSARDEAWRAAAVDRLAATYPAAPDVPRLVVSNPNDPGVAAFLRQIAPDLMIARCRVLLRPAVFTVPRLGTFVLHPGICPEYRNAHGCFWALSRRDLGRVGMTLLRIDEGVDTGPVYLHASCDFDECGESHVVIQERVVVENLERIADVLTDLHHGEARPLPVAGRASAVWGHPRLSAYLRWKHAAKRDRHARHLVTS